MDNGPIECARGKGDRRLIVDQCHGLTCAPPGRTMSAGRPPASPPGPTRRAAVLPPTREMAERRRRLSRRRRPAHHAIHALRRSTGRRLRGGRAGRRAIPRPRLQRRASRGLCGLADDHPATAGAAARRRLSQAALARANLRVEVHALATKILPEHGPGRPAFRIPPKAAAPLWLTPSGGHPLRRGLNSPPAADAVGHREPDELKENGNRRDGGTQGRRQELQDHMSARRRLQPQGAGPFLRKMRLDRIASISPAPICSARA